MDSALREMIRTFGLIERVMQPYFVRFGISGSQWGVLRNLHRAEQEGQHSLRLSELSKRLLIRPPSVTGLINRLERADLVTRSASPTDLRGRCIQLTSSGRHLVRRILEEHDDQVHLVLEGLDAHDQAKLSRLLSAWSRHLQRLLRKAEPSGHSRKVVRGT